jgi:hypothetical protein
MSETKAQREDREKHEEWEKQQEKDGHSVHLPRAGEVPVDGKKKTNGK